MNLVFTGPAGDTAGAIARIGGVGKKGRGDSDYSLYVLVNLEKSALLSLMKIFPGRLNSALSIVFPRPLSTLLVGFFHILLRTYH